VNAASLEHATATLRELDRDRYFAALVLPARVRGAAIALYAFNAEIAAISGRVREPAAGEIRLQWWRDALSGTSHGEVRQNPVADALLAAVEERQLPTAPLVRLIDARRFDLYNDPMPDAAAFEGYAGETASVLFQLVAMLLNGGPVEAADAAGHLGVAQAMIGHLRAFGYNAARGRIFLPWSVFAANGVERSHIFAGQSGDGLLAALGQIREMATSHLDKADRAVAALPRSLRSAFAPAIVLHAQLSRLPGQGPFDMVPGDVGDARKLALLLWRRLIAG